jgi:hypothetical protein
VLRRALFLLLVPLILGACGVSAGPAEAPAAGPVPPLVDAPLLQQWSSWSMAPSAERGRCAADPRFGSDLWFLAAPSGQTAAHTEQTTATWSCAVPAGVSILVVATSMSGATMPMCSRDYSEQVGVDGSASLDGTPVALRWLGPVTDLASPGPRTPPERTCALTGLTVPMSTGHHTLITQYILSGLIGTVTVEIDAS